MNLPQLQYHQNPRDLKLKTAQATSAKTTKRLADETIQKYNAGKLQSYKTISQASGITHSIPKPVCQANGWKIYTRFAYTTDPEKRELTLEPCHDTSNIHTLVLSSDNKIKIGYNICTLAGWDIGDTISVLMMDEKIIMKRIKNTKPYTQNVNHIHGTGCFSFTLAREIAKRRGWKTGTRFSCNAEDGRIVLEESIDGDRKINSRGRHIGLVNIPSRIVASAGLQKRDPVEVDYEDSQIIIRRAV